MTIGGESRDESEDHDAIASLLGAFALGAIEPEEEPKIRAHLSRCATCRLEGARLRTVVSLLGVRGSRQSESDDSP